MNSSHCLLGTELTRAMHRVASRYAALAEADRPDVNDSDWLALEALIDSAFRRRDQVATLQAIEQWEGHARQVLQAASP